jgi:hypothetical protein
MWAALQLFEDDDLEGLLTMILELADTAHAIKEGNKA